LGMRLDIEPVEWDEVAGVIEDAFIHVSGPPAP
jgi:hypothetical protein